jgi:hypothetical protein
MSSKSTEATLFFSPERPKSNHNLVTYNAKCEELQKLYDNLTVNCQDEAEIWGKGLDWKNRFHMIAKGFLEQPDKN